MLCLIVCCIAAMSATMYGVSSCRFAYVEYASDRGDFGTMFVDPTANNEAVTRRNGIGLFTWLSPFDADNDWTRGSCRGYSQLQLEKISDDIFEISRIFGVLSVLMGVCMASSTLFLACLSYNRFQIWLMSGMLIGLTVLTGMTFLLLKSAVCTDLVSSFRFDSENDPSVFTSSCSIDQGGLIVIAAAMLWFVTALISIVYVRPIHSEMIIVDGRIANAFEERQRIRQQRKKQALAGHRGGNASPSSGKSRTPATTATRSPHDRRSVSSATPSPRPRPAIVSPDNSSMGRSPASPPSRMRSFDDDDSTSGGEPPRLRPQSLHRSNRAPSSVVSVSDSGETPQVELQLQRLRRLAARQSANGNGSDYDSRSESSFEV